MKTKFFKTLALSLVLAFSVILTACGHEHTYAEAWSSNETHHWHAANCEHTEEKADYAEHSYKDNYDTTCETCGAVRVAPVDAWDGTIATALPAEDNGTITIYTAEELALVAKKVNEGTNFDGKTIKLGADIDLSHKEWTPIGFGSSDGDRGLEADAKAFAGNFDGGNHTVYNLRITTFVGGGIGANTATSGVALFGHVWGSVKNLTVDTATVYGNHYVAAVVGFAIGAEVENCHANNVFVTCVNANDDENGDKAGAVVAHVQNTRENNAKIKNCTASNSSVNAGRDAGQVVGCLSTNNYSGTTEATAEGLTATNVIVKDNNGVQKSDNKDNIKNEPIGRINDYRIV